MIKIPESVHVRLESPINTGFRCKMACDSLDIDQKKKSIHELKIDNIKIPGDWNIGMIYGASGSGKTTLAKKIFGDAIFNVSLDEETPVINQLPADLNYESCAQILNGIGLSSVPCWVRPLKTLSNGQRARAEAAIMMTRNNDIVVIDEFTSVVDRTVAKAMSHCVQKFARRQKKQIILLTCHHDIIEWIRPDWLIDCNRQEFQLPASADFFFQPREQLTFNIKQVDRTTWRYFSKYHYLSDKLPGGKIYNFGIFYGADQIGFLNWANYTPIRQHMIPIYHANRLVIHPDYQGIGIGQLLMNESARFLIDTYHPIKLMTKFSATPVFKILIKDTQWKFLGEHRRFGKMTKGGKMERYSGFREGGIKSYHFEFVGNKKQHEKQSKKEHIVQ
jgi:ABC-type lipoprotein export system ATPase subunit